jgi:hypothetical protein
MQTRTAAVCGVCVTACKQGRNKERSDNKPEFCHKRLRPAGVRDKLVPKQPLHALICVNGY